MKRCDYLIRIGHSNPYRVSADCGAANNPELCPKKRAKCEVNQSCWKVDDEKIVHPGSKVTINPVIINDTYRQKEEQHEC